MAPRGPGWWSLGLGHQPERGHDRCDKGVASVEELDGSRRTLLTGSAPMLAGITVLPDARPAKVSAGGGGVEFELGLTPQPTNAADAA